MPITNRRQPLVVANWKMNPVSLKDAKALFVAIRTSAKKVTDVEVVVAPPYPFVSELAKLSPSGSLGVGAQDVFYEEKGAFTGEVSPLMLATTGVTYVIIGHSERRALGETNEMIHKKVLAALKAKLNPILCVGEATRDQNGHFYDHIATQLRVALGAVPATRLKHITVAYEPIWAIGTGKNATASDVEEMQLFIRKILTELFGRAGAQKVRILYGGSVKADNAATLFTAGSVDGFLVGGASLKPQEFKTIIASTITH